MSMQIEERISSAPRFEITGENIFSVIKKRHATREYSSQQVSEEDIRSLIDFAALAPSAMNRQPWHFVVIRNQNLLKEISDQSKQLLLKQLSVTNNHNDKNIQRLKDSAFDIFYGAPVLIVICAKIDDSGHSSTESDCFLAGENLMLAATGMGLATCPIGLAKEMLREPAMRKKIGISNDYTPVLPIIVGYENEKPSDLGQYHSSPHINWIE